MVNIRLAATYLAASSHRDHGGAPSWHPPRSKRGSSRGQCPFVFIFKILYKSIWHDCPQVFANRYLVMDCNKNAGENEVHARIGIALADLGLVAAKGHFVGLGQRPQINHRA